MHMDTITSDHPAEAPPSPVTGINDTYEVDRLSTEDVIRAYGDIGLDVTSELREYQSLPVYRCAATGYRFFYPHSLAADSSFYTRLQKSRKYYATWRWEHAQAASLLASASRVLEIGTGSGNFLHRLREEFGKSVVGLELNETAVVTARERGLDVRSETVEEFASGAFEPFDAVCTFQVLEHVPDVKSFLDAACHLLRPGGMLLIGVPNNNPYLYKFDRMHALNLPPHHVGLWDKESLSALEQVFPLTLKEIRTEPLLDTEYFWEVLLKHWGAKRPLLAALARALPWRLQNAARQWAGRSMDGRNLLAVYQKTSIAEGA